MTVYGIKNCNTVKKALDWFNDHHVEYEFHDYKARGITEGKLKGWSKQVGWQDLINRKGTTWRQLDEKVRVGITNQTAAIKLMSEKPTVIRRPLIEEDGKVVVLGFEEVVYAEHFAR